MDSQEKASVKFESKYNFIGENGCGNVVCKMASIMLKPQCVDMFVIFFIVLVECFFFWLLQWNTVLPEY